MCRIRIVALATCCLSTLAGCAGVGSGTNYTKMSFAHMRQDPCGRSLLSPGEWIEPVITVTNTSGHDWKSTWLKISGTGDNLKLESHLLGPALSMNNQPVDKSFALASNYNLGPLPAGETGYIHIRLTVEKEGNPHVWFGVWGNSDANGSPELPENLNGLGCHYNIYNL
jgi:hypothetical protein